MSDQSSAERLQCDCGRPIREIERTPCRVNDGDCIDTVTERHSNGEENVIGVRVVRHPSDSQPEEVEQSDIDPERVRNRTKEAMRRLMENDPTHNIELDLQHIWVAAGGETGEPGTEEYMSELYPDR